MWWLKREMFYDITSLVNLAQSYRFRTEHSFTTLNLIYTSWLEISSVEVGKILNSNVTPEGNYSRITNSSGWEERKFNPASKFLVWWIEKIPSLLILPLRSVTVSSLRNSPATYFRHIQKPQICRLFRNFYVVEAKKDLALWEVRG